MKRRQTKTSREPFIGSRLKDLPDFLWVFGHHILLRPTTHTTRITDLNNVKPFSSFDVNQRQSNRKYEAFKKSNPPAQLTTNMVSWQNFSLDAAYRPHLGHFFWARHFKSGDAIQVAFKKAQNIRAIYIVTGFDKDEERAGNDRLVQGELLASANQDCSSWSLVTRQVDQWGKIAANLTMPKIHCLQVKVFKGTSDWLVIRLIRVMLMYSH